MIEILWDALRPFLSLKGIEVSEVVEPATKTITRITFVYLFRLTSSAERSKFWKAP